MQRFLLALVLLAAPPAARAQMASFCNGNVLAERFDTRVVPGPGGRATYSVLLRNTQARRLSVQVVVTAPILGRPTGLQSLPPSGMLNVELGYQHNLPGSQPLRGERLEQVTRVSCP